ncbi:MAG: hypothetical protein ACI9MC_001380 [Kiritimatiellia bacterium]|jgi:hypothetical protein
MTRDVDSALIEALDQSCTALFEHYKVSLTEDVVETTSPQTVAVIGFSGDEMRAPLGIVIAPTLVAKIRPIRLVNEDEDRALDD